MILHIHVNFLIGENGSQKWQSMTSFPMHYHLLMEISPLRLNSDPTTGADDDRKISDPFAHEDHGPVMPYPLNSPTPHVLIALFPLWYQMDVVFPAWKTIDRCQHRTHTTSSHGKYTESITREGDRLTILAVHDAL